MLRDKWLQEVFNSADKDGEGRIAEGEVENLMTKLLTGVTPEKIKQKLKVSVMIRK